MYFAVTHKISDVGGFWGAAQRELPNLPEGIRIHNVFPNAAMDNAICVWEAKDLDTIKEYLERQTSKFAQNDYLVINAANAMGLPEQH